MDDKIIITLIEFIRILLECNKMLEMDWKDLIIIGILYI
jgi:hypothetical protein